MICEECGNEYDDKAELFCPMCGAVSPTVEIPNEVLGSRELKDSSRPAIPQGYVAEPTTGLYYCNRKKRRSDGSCVNEITWFHPSTGEQAVKQYPMSEEQMGKMSRQEFENLKEDDTIQLSLYDQLYHDPKKTMKRKKGVVLGVIGLIAVTVIGICTWKFDWIPFSRGNKSETAVTSMTLGVQASMDEDSDSKEDPYQKALDESERLTEDEKETGNPLEAAFEFNEYDKQYFVPASDNYLLVECMPHVLELYSYDEEGNCIAYRMRMEQDAAIEKSRYETIKSNFQKGNFTNIEIMDRYIYCDCPIEKALFSQTGAEALAGQYNYKILLNQKADDTEVADGYTFTKADKKYFVPATDNYVIVKQEDNCLLLSSYDENNLCIQSRMRLECSAIFTQDETEEVTKMFEENLNATNIELVGSVAYMDVPYIASSTKEQMLSSIGFSGIELVEKHGGSAIVENPGIDESGYEFTKEDKGNFEPKTKNYVILLVKPSNHWRIYSFDEDGVCIQARAKMDFLVASENLKKEYSKTLKKEMGASNITYVGSNVYMDTPIPYRLSRESLKQLLKNQDVVYLVEEGETIPLKQTDHTGYAFTKADKKEFKPATDRYLITQVKSKTQEVLYSFDDHGTCVQVCVRNDFLNNITEEGLITAKLMFREGVNMRAVGHVVYFDQTIDDDSMTLSNAVQSCKDMGQEILVDHLNP